MSQTEQRSPSVVIIGAGMTGILMHIKLREAGIEDIVILEKKDKLGGTWRDNTYPGIACDVPAHLYTYSFAPNPNWSHRFAHGNEIQAYFENIAASYKVADQIRFNEAVTACRYESGKWHIKTNQDKSLVADFVICATGILHHPAKPDIPGLKDFSGPVFHTAEWDHSISLEGKRVGIIGTGSTAAQVVPALAKKVAKLSVFQRTPHWIVPIPNQRVTENEKEKLRKKPALMKRLRRLYSLILEETFSKAVIGKPLPHALIRWLCQGYLRFGIKDKQLREKLTPDYRVGCKRIIVSANYYQAIQNPNVELVTDKILQIEPEGIRTEDSRLHELDVLALATGFHPFNFMRPMKLVGKNGLDIDDAWSDKISAYRSLALPGFPNFFLMLGPNTPIGNFSVIAMAEAQAKYVLKLIARWRKMEFDEIEATPEAVDAFNKYLRKGMGKTVWVAGCKSWYLDKNGNPMLWPYTWKEWVKQMSEPVMADFNLKRL